MTARTYRLVEYRDELLADGTVLRSYSDDRREWRRRVDDTVHWRDGAGRTGVDEPLGEYLVKRLVHPDEVLYGRELGFGQTAWSDGVLTVKVAALGGRGGGLMSKLGAAGVFPTVVDPPEALTPEQEQELRRWSRPLDRPAFGVELGRPDDWRPSATSHDDFG